MKLNINKTERKTSGRYSFLISVCLVAAVLAVYWPVYSHDFVGYDDDDYVTNNTMVQSGLNWQGIRWAFTTGCAANWHPVTWLSLMLDYQLFKNWAGGYHIVNVLFHIINTLVLFYVLMRMTGAVWPSAFVAALFALHPLHVESVAWISERKDLLSTFFWLLTMWAYFRYVESPRFKWYLAAVVLFAAGLMAKPMLVTLPFVLLLLDFWPLGRKISWRLLVEKIPFFICSFASCVITFLVQQSGEATVAVTALGFGFKARVGNAIVSYLTYITKMIWPSRLAVFYPHLGDDLPAIEVVICGLLLVLISIGLIYPARRHRFLAVGWFWYLGTLVPVIGLLQVGLQAMADRYTYMTLTGLFIIIAWSAKEFVPRRQHKILALLAVIILIASGAAASQQLKYWKNTLLLFGHTMQVTKNNYIILDNYANSLLRQDRLDEAIRFFNKSLTLKPDTAEAHVGLGSALFKSGEVQQAIEHYRLAIKYKPNFTPAYNNLATALYKQGKKEEAVSYFEQALKIKPDYAEAHEGLGSALLQSGGVQQAIEHFRLAIKYKPNFTQAYNDLATALYKQGKNEEAIGYFEQALKLKPDSAEAHDSLGCILLRSDSVPAAIEQFRLAVKCEPNFTQAYNNLAAALYKQGKNEEAIGYFEQALKLKPDYAEAHDGLGRILLRSGKIPAATEHFRLAVKYNPEFSYAYRNLGAALFLQGKLEESVTCFKQALEIDPNFAEARFNLGTTLMKLQKFGEAIESFNKVLELEPANIIAHGYLGMALAAVGRTDEAVKEIRLVLNARPNDVVMHRHLGIILEKQGKITEAIESYRAALRIDPNDITAKQLLDTALKKQKAP